MALKTERAEAPAKPNDGTTILELALYKIYTWGANTYEQGKPYRFKNADAMQLMSEQDLGRPVWKIYRPVKVREVQKVEVMDATSVTASLPVEDPTVLRPDPKAKRIDVGSDDEIQDILKNVGDDSGDVTV